MRFPKLSETFILREMTELRRQGHDIVPYPLILQRTSVIHEEAKPWLPRMRYTPFISSDVLAANGKCMIQHPNIYARLWARVLWENRTSPKFLTRAILLFPKAIYMAARMQREGITHIHTHYATHPALVAWLIHQLTGIRFSVTVHAHDIFVRPEMLGTKLGDAAFVVAISDYNREHLAKIISPDMRKKTHVIRCGISAGNYPSRHETHQQGECFEMISIGSLEPYKGYPYLIKACALLRDRGIPFRCRIIGEGKDRGMLEKMITQAGLNIHGKGGVELLGAQSQEEVACLLPTAHCYVQPSIITPSGKMEGIPVALMEALACNLPVVASNISGIPELVKPGETGYLVRPADESALADMLITVYTHPEQADQMARNGYVLVQQLFDLHTNVKCLAMLFEDTINRN